MDLWVVKYASRRFIDLQFKPAALRLRFDPRLDFEFVDLFSNAFYCALRPGSRMICQVFVGLLHALLHAAELALAALFDQSIVRSAVGHR